MRALFIITFILSGTLCFGQATISGYVTDAKNGESLIGVTIYDETTQTGAVTNVYGFYSLTLPSGNHQLRVSYIGYETFSKNLDLQQNQKLDIELEIAVQQMQEVVITSDRYVVQEEVKSTQMGAFSLKPKEAAILPTIGGEADILKAAQLLPGVSRGGEGTTGMYVRGGTDDQNLVTLDEATVYNVGHLFGFFSVFNTDAIKDVNVIKGGFHASHGGRLSSVIDTRMFEGNKEKISVKGGVGILTSRLAIDGPISDKASFMVAGRRTYIDQVFGLFGTSIPYYFYDLNTKFNYKVSDRDRIYVSGYFGNDVLAFQEDVEEDEDEFANELTFGFNLGNFTTSVRWNHIYPNDKQFLNVTALQTNFKYDINGSFVDNNVLIKSKIQDFALKADWDYFLNPSNTIEYGVHAIGHFFRPNVVNTGGEISDFLESQDGDLIPTQEFAVYGGNEQKLSSKLSTYYGLRISSANVRGAFYYGVEPRLSMNHLIGDLTSLKASYSVMSQYMHRVSSSSIALPTDLWYPVTNTVKPQRSHQWSAGIFHGIERWNLNLSMEGFYKTMDNLIEYKEGARLLLNDNFEEELISGDGEAYGLEFLIRKKSGPITGWVGYTLSKARRNFDLLNNGLTYPAKYDRTHDLSVVGMIQLNEKISFSVVWVYTSGARYTAQTGQYLMPNASLTNVDLIPIYSDRNAVKLSPSHRLDFNFILKNNPKKKFNSEWQIGVYNFYNQATPYRVNVRYNGKTFQYVQPGFFGFIPSLSYNFSF